MPGRKPETVCLQGYKNTQKSNDKLLETMNKIMQNETKKQTWIIGTRLTGIEHRQNNSTQENTILSWELRLGFSLNTDGPATSKSYLPNHFSWYI